MGENKFETKLTKNSIKFSVSSLDDYSKMTKFIETEKVPFHTHAKPGTNKVITVVIQGLPQSIPQNEILEELKAKYVLLSVMTMVNKDKAPIPL